MKDYKAIEDCIYNSPLPLLSIKNERLLKVIDNYLPYSTGFEIEGALKPDKAITDIRNDFKSIPNIMDVDIDNSEQRFRIPNGLKGLICLYQISRKLKHNCLLNYGSGIHYHIDMTEWYHNIETQFVVEHSKWILEELESWEYKGSYNRKQCEIDCGGVWVRFQSDFKTCEIRIGEMTFDYPLLVKRIIHANSIVKTLKKFGNLTPEEIKLQKLKKVLSSFEDNVKEELNLEQINNQIKQRTILINNGTK